MKIEKIEINGFRGVKSGEVQFQDFTVLVGPNNCGKTTVIEALALLCGRDRLVRSLTEHDFYGSDPQPESRVHIVATITGFEPNDPARHPNWLRLGRGVPKWLDKETREIASEKRSENDLLACQIAFTARFDRASLEVETIRYFFDGNNLEDPFSDDASVSQIPVTLIKELGFFLVPASRTWDRMISFGSELFRRAVTYVGGKPAEAVIEERDRLRRPGTPLEKDSKLNQLVSQVDADINQLFGQKIELKLRLTSTDSEGVLDAVIPHFAHSDQIALPARRHGSGLISLQTLILLIRFGTLRVANGESFLMAIEEPELHVPPPQQRKLLHVMQQLATQTIVTTHSPTVAAVPNPDKVLLVVNTGGVLSARRLLPQPLDRSATNPRRGLFLSDRDATVTAIMNPSVIIPEGKTEASWLRLLARVSDLSCDGGSEVAFTNDVGVIPTKDARIADVYADLKSVHPMLTCLVDGDAAGQSYVQALSKIGAPRIFIWPDNWTIENVIAWVIAADESVLQNDELVSAGLPSLSSELADALRLDSSKADEVLHSLISDAISESRPCCARVRHILNVIGNVATGCDLQPNSAVSALQANGTTTVWTFNDAFPGI